MIKLQIKTPWQYRLDIAIVKIKKKKNPFLLNLGQLGHIKKGSKISRFFRIILEKHKIEKIIGVNLTTILMLTTLLPAQVGTNTSPEESILRLKDFEFLTQKGVQPPLKEVRITQGYKLYHPGVDLDGKIGDPVYPIMTGEVLEISYSNIGYGNAVIIKHNENISSLYAHLNKILVKPGEVVNLQTQIGEVGKSGNAHGDHLHLEIRDGKRAINPSSLIPLGN